MLLLPLLLQARAMEGVQCMPGVDTLLMHLLIDLGAAREAAAFAAVPHHVAAAAAAPRLQAAGWHHALAALWAAAGDAPAALGVWEQLISGRLPPGDASTAAAQRREALGAAAALLRDRAACDDALALACLAWLLPASQPEALGVLAARELAPADVLPLLPPEGDARWRYLLHLATDGASADPGVHTQLATALAAAIFRAAPALRRAEDAPPRLTPPRGPPVPLLPGGEVSVAALVSGGRPPDPAAAAADAAGDAGDARQPAAALRARLRLHLDGSRLWDPAAVGAALAGSALHEEQAVLHAARGDHPAALRALALTLRDVGAAEAYAAARLPPGEHRLLLHLVLSPGGGEAPRWADACHVVAALGASLDPLDVLEALPGDTPLAAAAAVVSPMLRERVHRRRQGQVAASLHRARAARAAAARAAAEAVGVTVDDARACPDCRLRLGGKVFVALRARDGAGDAEPAAVCFNCWRKRGGGGEGGGGLLAAGGVLAPGG